MIHQMEPSPPPKKRTFQAPSPPSPGPQRPPRPPRGGGGANDPIMGTKVHVPYSRGVDMGTVRSVHRRKAGIVWV